MEAIKEEAIVSQGLFRIAGLLYGLAGECRQTVAAQPEQHREGEYQQGLAICTVHISEGCTEILYSAGECLLVYQAKIVQIKNVDRRQETECLLEGPV